MADLTNYPGTEDRFTGAILLRQWIIRHFSDIYRDLGYNLVETPCLERGELLPKKGGTGLQPVFRFQDGHKDEVCLKPDQTVSLRRVVAQHNLSLPFPRHQVGLAFRQDKPERGRFREFTQCDADVIGAPVGLADAETILWLTKGLKAIGLGETVVFVNSRKVLTGLYQLLGNTFFDELTYVRAVDKLPIDGATDAVGAYLKGEMAKMTHEFDVKEGERAIAVILAQLPILGTFRDQPVQVALSEFGVKYPSLSGEVDDLRKVMDYSFALGVQESDVRFDPCLARGMDYYTGPVFEARNAAWPYGSLAGGGRYDEMVEIDGKVEPAVGASFGLERIETALKELDRLPAELKEKSNLADVMFATQEDWVAGLLPLAKALRDAGLRTLIYPRPADKLGVQTRFASRNGIKAIVFFGADEEASGEATLRFVSDDKEIQDRREAGKNKEQKVRVDPISDLVDAISKLNKS